jgi:large subunit ribosomal protein L1
MPKHGKRYRAAAEKVDRMSYYEPTQAVKLVKELAFAKFDESVEVHIRTGLDPRHADQVVRSSAVLPAGTGRTRRVVAFAQGDKAREAEEAGADHVGAEDLVQRIQGGWTDFDVAVATPDLMGMLGRLG